MISNQAHLRCEQHHQCDHSFHISLYENYDRIDGVAHIAGVLGYLSPLINTSLQQLKSVMEINFESNFLLTQLLLPLLFQSDNPSVVFTSSGVGRKGRALPFLPTPEEVNTTDGLSD